MKTIISVFKNLKNIESKPKRVLMFLLTVLLIFEIVYLTTTIPSCLWGSDTPSAERIIDLIYSNRISGTIYLGILYANILNPLVGLYSFCFDINGINAKYAALFVFLFFASAAMVFADIELLKKHNDNLGNRKVMIYHSVLTLLSPINIGFLGMIAYFIAVVISFSSWN